MQTLVPFTNETTKYVVVGLVTIPPGQTRDVDPTLLPEDQAEASAPVAQAADWLTALLAQKATDIVATLPSLTPAQIEALGEAEQKSAARKTVLSAIAEALLSAANSAVGQGALADEPPAQAGATPEQQG